MTALAVLNPYPQFFELDGDPLDNGRVYFGQVNQNPLTSPVSAFWNPALTQQVAQPARTKNGYIFRGGSPALVYIDGAYSLLVQDKRGRTVFYAPNSAEFGNTFTLQQIITDFIASLAASSGSSLIGFIQAGIGAVARTLQAKAREVKSFEDFGAVGDNVADDTSKIQAAIDACKGRLIGDPTKTYKVTSTLILHSDIDIDLNGSTVNWAGATVTNANKASKWDNAVFRANEIAPSPVKRNIKVRNGTINTNDWGCAVSLKQVEGFEVSDITTSNAQAAGIAVQDCINGKIARNKLTDCAANAGSGFTPSTDLEAWSDGIFVFYGSQAITVEDNTVINTRVGTGRGGIVVDDAVGGSAESGRKTSAITVRDNRVQGYDRQAHAEYCYATTFQDNDFNFVASGVKTFSTIIVDWNTEDVTWLNNRGRTVRGIAMMSGSTNVNVIGGSYKKTGADTGNCFSNQSGVVANVRFRGVLFDFGAGPTNIYRWRHSWEDCEIRSTAYLLCSHYESNGRWIRCSFTNAAMWSTGFGLATDSMEFTDCNWSGFTGTNYTVNVAFGSLFIRRGIYEAGDVRVNCTKDMVFSDMSVNALPTVDGSPPKTSVDGIYLGSAKPVAGTWVKGDLMRNTNPTAGGVPFFECVTSGTPGTWKNHAVMEA